MPCPEPRGRCRAGVDGRNAIAVALEAQPRVRDHGTAFASPARTAMPERQEQAPDPRLLYFFAPENKPAII